MNSNALDVLATLAIAVAVVASVATFTHALRHPWQTLQGAKAERLAFRALFELREGEIGNLIPDLRVLARIEAGSSEEGAPDKGEARRVYLASTLKCLKSIEQSQLSAHLERAALGAY